jgi:hypothetical protein
MATRRAMSIVEAENRALQVVVAYEDTKPKPPTGAFEYTADDFYIIKFSYSNGSWMAFVGSDVFRTVYYEVHHNGRANRTDVEIYHRIGKFTVTGDDFASHKTGETNALP